MTESDISYKETGITQVEGHFIPFPDQLQEQGMLGKFVGTGGEEYLIDTNLCLKSHLSRHFAGSGRIETKYNIFNLPKCALMPGQEKSSILQIFDPEKMLDVSSYRIVVPWHLIAFSLR